MRPDGAVLFQAGDVREMIVRIDETLSRANQITAGPNDIRDGSGLDELLTIYRSLTKQEKHRRRGVPSAIDLETR